MSNAVINERQSLECLRILLEVDEAAVYVKLLAVVVLSVRHGVDETIQTGDFIDLGLAVGLLIFRVHSEFSYWKMVDKYRMIT